MSYNIGRRDTRWMVCLITVFVMIKTVDDCLHFLVSYFVGFSFFQESIRQELLYQVLRTIIAGCVVLIPLFTFLLYRASIALEMRVEMELRYKNYIDRIWKGIPQSIIAECEAIRGNGMANQHKLMELVGNGQINHGYGEGLMNVYHKLSKPPNSLTLEAMHRIINVEKQKNGNENEVQGEEEQGFDRKTLDEMKIVLDYLPQKRIDRIWDTYMQKTAKAAEESNTTQSKKA